MSDFGYPKCGQGLLGVQRKYVSESETKDFKMYKWHLREFHKYRAFRESRLVIMLGSLPSKNANFMYVQFIHGFAPFARNFKY